MVAMTNLFLAYSIKQAFAKILIDFWEDLQNGKSVRGEWVPPYFVLAKGQCMHFDIVSLELFENFPGGNCTFMPRIS
jgi:hypothetical protein